MSRRPPFTVWLSFAVMIATMATATWQAIDSFQKVPISVDDPAAVQNAGLLMGATLFGVWLIVALPTIGTLYGVRFCRLILTVFAVIGVLVMIVYHPAGGWQIANYVLKAVQVFGIALLYVGPSRVFFAADEDR
jgi:hypothetical protein